jgi:hypothetical protein
MVAKITLGVSQGENNLTVSVWRRPHVPFIVA